MTMPSGWADPLPGEGSLRRRPLPPLYRHSDWGYKKSEENEVLTPAVDVFSALAVWGVTGPL